MIVLAQAPDMLLLSVHCLCLHTNQSRLDAMGSHQPNRIDKNVE